MTKFKRGSIENRAWIRFDWLRASSSACSLFLGEYSLLWRFVLSCRNEKTRAKHIPFSTNFQTEPDFIERKRAGAANKTARGREQKQLNPHPLRDSAQAQKVKKRKREKTARNKGEPGNLAGSLGRRPY